MSDYEKCSGCGARWLCTVAGRRFFECGGSTAGGLQACPVAQVAELEAALADERQVALRSWEMERASNAEMEAEIEELEAALAAASVRFQHILKERDDAKAALAAKEKT